LSIIILKLNQNGKIWLQWVLETNTWEFEKECWWIISLFFIRDWLCGLYV